MILSYDSLEMMERNVFVAIKIRNFFLEKLEEKNLKIKKNVFPELDMVKDPF